MRSLLLLIAAAAYSPPARRWYLGWGATAAERELRLPGDDLTAAPDVQSTRAVTIDAPPASVWPWLVQMGSGRGGAYSDFGPDVHRILPEFQDLALGDELLVGGGGPRLRVEIRDPDRTLALRSADGTRLWSLHLMPVRGRTRLISRNRIALTSRAQRVISRLVREPGSLIVERRMLLGIKRRAEHNPRAMLRVSGPALASGRAPVR
jgi:hypothetical protein